MRPEYDFSKGKRGAVLPQKGKTRISIFIDNALLDAFRARAEKAGTGYQTMMNEALRRYLSDAEPPVTETVLRHVLRQEIPEYLHDPDRARINLNQDYEVREAMKTFGVTREELEAAVRKVGSRRAVPRDGGPRRKPTKR